MKDVATVIFDDAESNAVSAVVVRAAAGTIALALTQSKNGDIEVFLPTDAAREIIAALTQAIVESERLR